MLNVDFNNTLFPQFKTKNFTLTCLFVKYGPTNLSMLFEKFIIPSLVLELGGLGYFVKYPSPPRSSTKLGKIIEESCAALFNLFYPD